MEENIGSKNANYFKTFFWKSLIKRVIYYEHEVVIINFIPIVIINKKFTLSMK